MGMTWWNTIVRYVNAVDQKGHTRTRETATQPLLYNAVERIDGNRKVPSWYKAAVVLNAISTDEHASRETISRTGNKQRAPLCRCCC